MTRFLLLACLLATSATSAAGPDASAPADPASARRTTNWDVMLSQYPARAREAREQGPVGFRIKLDRDGYATECVVTSSSGYPALDDETCRLIMTRGEFKGVTDEHGRKANATFEGVVNWRLPGPPPAATAASAPAPSAPVPSASPAPVPTPAPVATARAGSAGKLICRRKLRTGTLAQYDRTCLTEADWQRYIDNQRAFWQDQQGIKGHGCDPPPCQ
jgi:TonB family protein